MANFNLVIDSKFEPFSFERYLQPYALYKEAYKEQEEALNTASEKAAELAELADAEGSRESYAAYQSYMDDLNAAVDELSTQGLSNPLRSTIFGLKPRYNKELVPIRKAMERGRELADEQRKFQVANNGDLRFDKDYSTMSIDELRNNPNASYTMINGKEVAAEAGNMVKNLSQSMLNKPEITSTAGGKLLLSKMQSGVPLDVLIAEAEGTEDLKGVAADLRKIRNLVHNKYKDRGAYDKDWIDSYVTQGILSNAQGAIAYNLMQDPGYLNPLQQVQRASLMNEYESSQPQYIGKDEDGNTRFWDPLNKNYFVKKTDSKGKTYRQYSDPVETYNSLHNTSKLKPVLDANGNTGNRVYNPSTGTFQILDAQGQLKDDPDQNNYGTPLAPKNGKGDDGKSNENATMVANFAKPVYFKWGTTFDDGFHFRKGSTPESIRLTENQGYEFDDAKPLESGKILRSGYNREAVIAPLVASVVYRTNDPSEIQITTITNKLKDENTFNKVSKYLDIRDDSDWFSNDEVRVAVKGTNKDYGNPEAEGDLGTQHVVKGEADTYYKNAAEIRKIFN